MYRLLILTLILLPLTVIGQESQEGKKTQLNLTNALVIGQMDKQEDRYSIEVSVVDLFKQAKIKAMPSLNVMKIGSNALILASDSITNSLQAKGIDTYCLISVRGYDKKFKVTQNQPNLKESLQVGSLFEMYYPDVVSVSFEFKFYRGGEFVFGDIIKCGNVGAREDVMKKLRKKISKKLVKKWVK